MTGKEYLGDEKTKRILSGEPFWCCAAFIDEGKLVIIKPRETNVSKSFRKTFTVKDMEKGHYMLYKHPVENVSIFDHEKECRESFMLMLRNLEREVIFLYNKNIDELTNNKDEDMETIRKHITDNIRLRPPFPRGGYTWTEKECIPPIDVAVVRKNMERISVCLKILDMLNMWLEDE